eukprot:403367844
MKTRSHSGIDKSYLNKSPITEDETLSDDDYFNDRTIQSSRSKKNKTSKKTSVKKEDFGFQIKNVPKRHNMYKNLMNPSIEKDQDNDRSFLMENIVQNREDDSEYDNEGTFDQVKFLTQMDNSQPTRASTRRSAKTQKPLSQMQSNSQYSQISTIKKESQSTTNSRIDRSRSRSIQNNESRNTRAQKDKIENSQNERSQRQNNLNSSRNVQSQRITMTQSNQCSQAVKQEIKVQQTNKKDTKSKKPRRAILDTESENEDVSHESKTNTKENFYILVENEDDNDQGGEHTFNNDKSQVTLTMTTNSKKPSPAENISNTHHFAQQQKQDVKMEEVRRNQVISEYEHDNEDDDEDDVKIVRRSQKKITQQTTKANKSKTSATQSKQTNITRNTKNQQKIKIEEESEFSEVCAQSSDHENDEDVQMSEDEVQNSRSKSSRRSGARNKPMENPQDFQEPPYILEIVRTQQDQNGKTQYVCVNCDTSEVFLTAEQVKLYYPKKLNAFNKNEDQDLIFDEPLKINNNSNNRKIQQASNKQVKKSASDQDQSSGDDDGNFINGGLQGGGETIMGKKFFALKQKNEERELQMQQNAKKAFNAKSKKKYSGEKNYEIDYSFVDEEDEMYDDEGKPRKATRSGKKPAQKLAADIKSKVTSTRRGGGYTGRENDTIILGNKLTRHEEKTKPTPQLPVLLNEDQIHEDEIFQDKQLIPRKVRKIERMSPETPSNCGYVCTIEWFQEMNGRQIEPCKVSYESVRIRYPNLICDYFERTMTLIQQ